MARRAAGLLDRLGLAELVALGQVEADLLAVVSLLGKFDTLGQGLRADVSDELHESTDELFFARRSLMNLPNQADIELDEVGWDLGKFIEPGLPCSKIVVGQTDPQVVEL